MSTNIIVQGIKIYLPTEETQNTAIGLYTSAGVSQFRWIENSLTGLVETWKTGMLLEDGIPPVIEESDWRRGVDMAFVTGRTFMINNTSQFYKSLSDASISLNGLKMELIEFSKNVSTSVITETIRYRGVTKVDTWNVTSYMLPTVPAILNRNANILTPVNVQDYPDASDSLINNIIPATFGKFSNGRYAKMIRTADKENVYLYSQIISQIGPIDDFLILNSSLDQTSVFPIVDDDGDTPPIEYHVKVGYNSSEGGYCNWFGMDGTNYNAIGGTFDCSNWFTGKYLKAVKGTGEGLARYIESAEIDFTTDESILKLTLSDYFEETLVGNATATAENQSWVSIVDINSEYKLDVWNLKSFIDSDGDEINTSDYTENALELYAYSDSKIAKVTTENVDANVLDYPYRFLRLPEYAYTAYSNNSNNKIIINVKLFEENIDTLNSFIIKPIERIALFNDSNLGVYWDNSYTKKMAGLYANYSRSSGEGAFNLTVQNGLDCMIDKDYSTYTRFVFSDTPGHSGQMVIAFKFVFPDAPENFEFDDVYLLADIFTDKEMNYFFKWKRWIGASNDERNFNGLSPNAWDWTINSIPDFYYLPHNNIKNKYFYYNNDDWQTVSGPITYKFTSGYMNNVLSAISTIDDYNSVCQAAIIFQSIWTGAITFTRYFDITQIAVAFRKSVSIKDAIYTPIKGRVFADSWGQASGSSSSSSSSSSSGSASSSSSSSSSGPEVGRKTSSDMMENPVDMFEHLCRLQNYSDEGDSVTEFGKQYSYKALVNVGTSIGGFDYSDLNEVKDLRPSFQVLDYDKGWIENLKREFCRTFWFTNYTDENGKECISFIPKSDTVSDTISFSDIPIGMSIGDVEEPGPDRIYAEPFVRYNYNAASDKYDGLLKIKNVHMSTWDSSYTPGFTGASGEIMWGRCKNELWNNARQITEPPSDMTDKWMISTIDDAIWYLDYWITWMTRKRIPVPVYYDKAKSWHIGRHVYLNLPHQTNASSIECVIEKIEKNIKAGVCNLNLVIIGDLPEEYYYIKDVMYTASEGADVDWKDTMTVYGNDNDKIDTM